MFIVNYIKEVFTSNTPSDKNNKGDNNSSIHSPLIFKDSKKDPLVYYKIPKCPLHIYPNNKVFELGNCIKCKDVISSKIYKYCSNCALELNVCQMDHSYQTKKYYLEELKKNLQTQLDRLDEICDCEDLILDYKREYEKWEKILTSYELDIPDIVYIYLYYDTI